MLFFKGKKFGKKNKVMIPAEFRRAHAARKAQMQPVLENGNPVPVPGPKGA